MRNSFLVTGLLMAFAAPAAYAADVVIDQTHNQFSKNAVNISVGDSVHFTNSDTVTHDIRITDPSGQTNDKGLQKPGETIAQTFPKAGIYHISCAIHPRMKLTVTAK